MPRTATVHRRVRANWAHTGRSFILDPGEYEVADLVNDVAYLEPPDGGPQACVDSADPNITISETED